jgi:pyrroloquinoline quinone (PQQ) biosynthesis protein C
MLSKGLGERLSENPLRKQLIHHPFFKDARTGVETTREKLGAFLGQWWYPLAYFPTFLSRTVSVVPMLEMQTAISKILYQELGEGDPGEAHSRLYVRTMESAGFDEATVTLAPKWEETRRLVDRYEGASASGLSALGFVYGTEVADLAMVSGVGHAVRNVTGLEDLPWVDIHVKQEPDHVAQATEAIEPTYSRGEEQAIIESAEEMWRLWIAFFDKAREVVYQSVAEPVAVGAH